MTAYATMNVAPGRPALGERHDDNVALLVLCLALFLGTLDVSVINIALPSIESALRLSPATLPWVQGAYVLPYGGLVLLGGRSADLVGRRRVFMAGTAVFGAASLLAGVASAAWMLLVARAIQGVGAAFILPAAVSILTTTFPEGPARNRALGVFGATGSVGFASGLAFGGFVSEFVSWHWAFLVNIPPVALVLVAAPRVLPADERRTLRLRSFDIPGAILGTLAAVAAVLGVTLMAEGGTLVAGALTTALAALAALAFVRVERRSTSPLLPLSIFRLPTVRAGNLASVALLGSFFGYLFVLTIVMQDVRGFSALYAALLVLPATVMSAIMSKWVSPWLVDRVGAGPVAAGALLLNALGIGWMIVAPSTSEWVSMLPSTLVISGLGMGIGYPALAMASVSGVESARQGVAAGLQSTSLQIGGGLGVAVASLAMHGAAGLAPHWGFATMSVLALVGSGVAIAGLRGARGPSTEVIGLA